MTEPQPVMAQAEQDQLTRQVGRALLSAAGADWQQVRAEYRSAGRHVEVDVYVKGPDGVERTVRPPQEVVDGLGRLRQGMYRPGRGTWLSALYVLDPPSAFSAEFEPDAEPRWRRVPPPIGFADELRFFPRADESIPDWLRQRAGLPPAGTTEGEPGQGGVSPQRNGPQGVGPQGNGPQGPPTPPPGIPFGGQGPASPPRGFAPQGEAAFGPTPPRGFPTQGEHMPPPPSPPRGFAPQGEPRGPHGNQPAPQGQYGVPATPFGPRGDEPEQR